MTGGEALAKGVRDGRKYPLSVGEKYTHKGRVEMLPQQGLQRGNHDI